MYVSNYLPGLQRSTFSVHQDGLTQVYKGVSAMYISTDQLESTLVGINPGYKEAPAEYINTDYPIVQRSTCSVHQQINPVV